METVRRYWLALCLTAAGFAASGAFYGALPARIPVHWNLHGDIDGWMPKSMGAFSVPIVAVVVLVLMIAAAPRAVRRPDSGSFGRLYPQIVAAVAALLLYATLLLLLVGSGLTLNVPASMSIGLGLVITLMGDTLGKVPRNSTLGIRTPWTLADEEVWLRTQRVGGWLFVLAGLTLIVTGFLGRSMVLGIAAVVAAALVPTAYSYLLWRRRHGGGGRSP